jgi:hypothetical protein
MLATIPATLGAVSLEPGEGCVTSEKEDDQLKYYNLDPNKPRAWHTPQGLTKADDHRTSFVNDAKLGSVEDLVLTTKFQIELEGDVRKVP